MAPGGGQGAKPSKATSNLCLSDNLALRRFADCDKGKHLPSLHRNLSRKSTFFLPRDAIHKRGLCCHAVCVCVSVTFVDCVKTNKHIFEMFSPFFTNTVLVFPHQTGWRYSDGNPPNGGVECRLGRQITRLWTNIWFRCIQVYSVVNRTSREV